MPAMKGVGADEEVGQGPLACPARPAVSGMD